MNATEARSVDLQTAADQLGVHYQTAYRWVRTGRLDADMVGGRYVVAASTLEELERSRRTPTPPPPPKRARLEQAAERMHAALVAGDETAAARIARRLADEGAPVTAVVQEVLVPPLRRIGQQWSDGHVSIWTEHRASAIVERLLGDLAPNPRGRRRGVVAVAAMSGDRHTLPTTMAAVALRDDNWHVHHLGADLPPEQFREFCERHDVTLAVISVTNPDVEALAVSTAAELRAAGTPTLVGSRGESLEGLLEQARSVTR